MQRNNEHARGEEGRRARAPRPRATDRPPAPRVTDRQSLFSSQPAAGASVCFYRRRRSSSVTLKNGVENMLMHYIPEARLCRLVSSLAAPRALALARTRNFCARTRGTLHRRDGHHRAIAVGHGRRASRRGGRRRERRERRRADDRLRQEARRRRHPERLRRRGVTACWRGRSGAWAWAPCGRWPARAVATAHVRRRGREPTRGSIHYKRSRPRGDYGAQLGDVDLGSNPNTPTTTAAF